MSRLTGASSKLCCHLSCKRCMAEGETKIDNQLYTSRYMQLDIERFAKSHQKIHFHTSSFTSFSCHEQISGTRDKIYAIPHSLPPKMSSHRPLSPIRQGMTGHDMLRQGTSLSHPPPPASPLPGQLVVLRDQFKVSRPGCHSQKDWQQTQDDTASLESFSRTLRFVAP